MTDLLDIAHRRAAARVRFAQQFMLHRTKVQTDKQAEMAAIEATGDELTIIEAEWYLAQKEIGNGS